jgi:aspartyl-tRNA(Asn)/glutamyl-tRNA(Gln) amidotransferase subunit A
MWTRQTASSLLGALTRRDVTSAQLCEEVLAAIRRHDPALRAYLHVDEERVMAQAQVIDDRRARGEPLGSLAGLPVAIKDNLCVEGEPTTCASKMLHGFRPPYDAYVVTRLRQADAILLGKTNLDEFAMGSSTENSAFQVTRNPWDTSRIPGGSSGGSAAAVAGGLAPAALGSDTGGSVRQPAALCGVVGLKPSYGRVSRFGLIAFGSSLDQVGTLTRDVADAALLLQAIAGHDPRDATCADAAVPAYLQTLEEPVSPLTIGVPREFFAEGLAPEVESAIKDALRVYEDLGATLVDVSLPHTRYALAAYYLVAPAEASSNLARYDGVRFGHRAGEHGDLQDMIARSRGEGFGPEVKRRIMLGTYALSSGYRDAYYLKALEVRRLIRNDFDAIFAHCDVIAGPTTPTVAFPIGSKADDPLSMYLADVYTISANLAGIAGISIPCGQSPEGLPIGLQLLAAPLAEDRLLRVARAYERVTDWHLKRPDTFA